MAKDLPTFLSELERFNASDLLRVSEPLDPRFEIPAFLQALESAGRYPVVICENPLNLKGEPSRFALMSNLFASRERCAFALGSSSEALAWEYRSLEQRTLQPVVIGADQAPVKHTVLRGEDVDLFELPVVTHHEHDSGPFITAGVVVAKDPDDGVYNLGYHRVEIKGPRKTCVRFNRYSQNFQIQRKHEERDEPMRVAVVIGHHPRFCFGAQTATEPGGSEYNIAGGMLEEPLELVPSATWGDDFLVPARAEIIIEGIVPPHHREPEAPVGEFTRYYGKHEQAPIIEVTALSHREEAIYHDIFISHPENQILIGIPLESSIYHAVKALVPGVRNVHLPMSGCCAFHAYIQIDKKAPADSITALYAALPASFVTKHFVVVDTDVNIFDDREVLWAIATRTQWDRDVRICPSMPITSLDPSSSDWMSAKALIDATKPAPPAPYAQKVTLPEEVLKKMEDVLKGY